MGLETQTDEQAVASSVEDPDAFVLIFDRHFDRIAGYLSRRAPASRVEELTSEVFVRAFKGRRRYDPDKADVLPWLYGIATNVLRESAREERRFLALIDRVATSGLGSLSVFSGERATTLAPQIASALGRLAADEREPLFLYALADLDYRQIAEALDIPVGTVKSRINRARGRLRQELAEAVAPPQLFKEEGISNG